MWSTTAVAGRSSCESRWNYDGRGRNATPGRRPILSGGVRYGSPISELDHGDEDARQRHHDRNEPSETGFNALIGLVNALAERPVGLDDLPVGLDDLLAQIFAIFPQIGDPPVGIIGGWVSLGPVVSDMKAS